METVIASEAKETTSLASVKDIAHKTATTLLYIRGSRSWFGKEWLTPLDIKTKFKEERIDITEEEIQIILHELSSFLVTERENQKSPITKAMFQDITRNRPLGSSSASEISHSISETKHLG